MLVPLITIGNSKGIIIPKSILEKLNIKESLDLEINDKEILLKPIHKKARKGWSKEFKKMNNTDYDKLLIDETLNEDYLEWEW